ncbi:MAG TPA: YceH family protein [Kiritimatiellia bacterium]|nr:YceH family protein [Kiritimatiellia bacterium]
MKPDLTPLEARILGCLVEKELATPEYYPLTLNALVAACNQKNNRDPEMHLAADEVEKGLAGLQYDKKLVGTYSGVGSRAVKYVHRLLETLGVDTPELAILCELLLRGPQTPGELRGRASRMHPFASPAEVRAVLLALAARPEPYVVELPRAPGCKENRFAHAFGPLPDVAPAAAPAAVAPAPVRPPPDSGRIHELERRIAELEAQIAALRRS